MVTRTACSMALAMIFALAASYSTAETANETWTQLRCAGKRGVSYYPPEARQRRESGAVLLEYSVNGKGVPERVVVLESTAPAVVKASAGA